MVLKHKDSFYLDECTYMLAGFFLPTAVKKGGEED
jgi:hypothetical protein